MTVKYKKALLVRADRIGDILLSTPTFRAFKDRFPQTEVTLLVNPATIPLLERLPGMDRCWSYEAPPREKLWTSIQEWSEKIKKENFDLAVVLQHQWPIALSLAWAGVPLRIGPLSKISSYFLYNRGLRQRRSAVEKHEADYNLQLLEQLDIEPDSLYGKYCTEVFISKEASDWAQQWLTRQGWRPEQEWIAIHPGMGGSAANCPPAFYEQICKMLIQKGYGVVITTGPQEGDIARDYEQKFFGQSLIIYRAEKGEALDQLGAIFQHCALVLAPSTGPMHLAVSLRRPVVALFPSWPKVQSLDRWGPYGADPQVTRVFEPDPSYDRTHAMESISPLAVLQSIEQLLARKPL